MEMGDFTNISVVEKPKLQNISVYKLIGNEDDVIEESDNIVETNFIVSNIEYNESTRDAKTASLKDRHVSHSRISRHRSHVIT